MLLSRFVTGMLSVSVLALSAGTASGQAYPNRPIRIVTSAPGGGNDVAARIIALGVSGPLGQPVIVENRASIASKETAAKAQPDGYTLYMVGNLLWTGPLLKNEPYDPLTEFSPVTMVSSRPFLLVVHPSVPAKSVSELISLAKAKPGGLNIAGNSVGSDVHLAAELLKSMAGINMVVVPYSGGGQGVIALLANEVQAIFLELSAVGAHIKSGKLRALAVSSLQPSSLSPGLPPVAASLPGFEIIGITGIYAPIKTPGAVINHLNREIVRFLKSPEGTEKFMAKGDDVVGSTPQELVAKIKATVPKYATLIKNAGIKVE